MAILKNLKQRNYFLRESNTNNPYLNLNGLDDVVGSGFHSFYILGSEYLQKGSEIQFEIIDSGGNPVSINAVRSIRKGNSRVVSFSIDKDVLDGGATLYVSSILNTYLDSDGNIQNIPQEYNSKPNLLFTYNFTVNKDKNNSDDIIFQKKPYVSITPTVKEVKKVNKKSITVDTGSGGNYLTGSIINVNKISESEYIVDFKSTENIFSGSMNDGEIRFTERKYNGNKFSYITYDRYPTDDGYSGDIINVKSKNQLRARFVNPDISAFGGGKNINYLSTFLPKNQDIIYAIDYRTVPYNEETLIQQKTYADIIIRNLQTVSGDAEKVKIYTKSDSEGTDYSLAFEGRLNEQASLLEIVDNFDIGTFNSSSKINKWILSNATNSGDVPADTTPELLLDNSKLLDGALITGSNDVFTKTVNGSVLQKPLYSMESDTSFKLYKGIDYNIGLNTLVENVIENDTRMDVYISGSGIPGGAGNRFGELIHSFRTNADKKWDKTDIKITYNPDYNITNGSLVLVITSGKWYVSDISIKPDILKGFSVGEYRAQIPLNVLRKNQDFDFKFEFFDDAGNKANTVLYKNNITFERPNLVIEGDNNLLTGSLYVGDNTGSGIHYGGFKDAGSIASVGYTGFISASTGLGPTGFLMFSGSVLPNSGDDYKGVGLELVAGTSSYFKYRTNPQELTVLTDNFFFGSDAQFISGSNGNIEISSSIFHLDPANNILVISGTIQATYGRIGGFEITPNALTGSGFFLSGSATGNEYFISSSKFNVKASGDITGSSVLFDGGKIGGWKIANSYISSSNLIINSDGTLSTADFADGVKGWIITSKGNGTAQFENVKIRGTLRTTVFEKDTVNAVGGQLWIANSTTLSQSIAPSDTTMSVANATGFTDGEILLVKKVDNTGFHTEYMLLQSSSRFNPTSSTQLGGNLYVQRAYDAGLPTASGDTWISELASSASNYSEGQVVVSTGKPNTGWIMANANPRQTYTPYLDIVERTGSGVYDYQLKARLGDLSGLSQTRLLGVNPNNAGFGLYSENVFLEGGIRATFGNIGGFGISDGVLSGSNFFLSGSATGNGQFINSNDTFIVRANGDVTASNAFISGSVYAHDGKIGNWNIIDGKISGSNITLDASGSLIYKTDQGPGSDPQAPGFAYLADEYYIDFTPKPTGSDSFYVKFGPNFSIDSGGTLVASGATFQGTITASAGIIGGFIINSSSISSPGNSFYLSGSAVGNEYFISSSKFNVKANGNMTASNALISGVINVTGGNVATTSSVNNVSSSLNTTINSVSSSASTARNNVSSSASNARNNISGSLAGSITTNSASLSGRIVTDANNKIIKPNPTPTTGAGLYLASSHMGYYNSSNWNAYISSSGEFLFQKDANNKLSFGNGSFILNISDEATISGSQINLITPNFFFGDSSTQYISGSGGSLEISSSEFYLNNGNAIFGGTLSAVTGDFSGTITSSAGLIGGWNINTNSLSSLVSNTGLILSSSNSFGSEILMLSASQDVLTIQSNGQLPTISSPNDLTYTGSAPNFSIGRTATTNGKTTYSASSHSSLITGFDSSKLSIIDFDITGSASAGVNVFWNVYLQGSGSSTNGWENIDGKGASGASGSYSYEKSLQSIGYDAFRIAISASSVMDIGEIFDVYVQNISEKQYITKTVLNENGIFQAVAPNTYLSLAGSAGSGGSTTSISSPVTSVFGRVGDITAENGDYDFTLISGTASDAQMPASYNNSQWDTAYSERGSQIAGTGLNWNGTKLDLIKEQVQDYGWDVLTGTQTLINVTYNDSSNNVSFIVNNDLSNYDNSSSGFYSSGSNGIFNNLSISGDFSAGGSLLSTQENTDADIGTETVASITGSYDSAFFDFFIKSGSNLRAGTVYAIHNGATVEYTEISTNDIGNTSDVVLSVDVAAGNIRLLSTVSNTNNWTIKSLVRGL